MVEFEVILTPFDQELRAIGFKARAKRWWVRQYGEGYQAVRLDKSSYGPKHSPYICVTFRQDKPMKDLVERDFGIRVCNFEDGDPAWKMAFDQNAIYMLPKDWELAIRRVVREMAVVLEKASTRQGVQELRGVQPPRYGIAIVPGSL